MMMMLMMITSDDLMSRMVFNSLHIKGRHDLHWSD